MLHTRIVSKIRHSGRCLKVPLFEDTYVLQPVYLVREKALVMAKVSPAQFVRQVRQEVSRISWASRRDTGLATITVFVMATIAAIFFLLVDMVLSNAVQFVLGFGG